MTENKKTQVDDFRDIRGYYDLIFDIMRSLTTHFSENNYAGIVANLRHLTMNAAPYLPNFIDVLNQIETEYGKLFDEKFQKAGKMLSPTEMSKDLEKEYLDQQDEFRKFARKLSGLIFIELAQAGLLPKAKKVKVEEINSFLKKHKNEQKKTTKIHEKSTN